MPLRDRPDDVRPLVEQWCATHASDFETRPVLSAAAWEIILAHPWPGNVRELMTVLDAAGRPGRPVIGHATLHGRLRDYRLLDSRGPAGG